MIKTDLKRAIISRYFIIGTLILYASFVSGVIFDMMYSLSTDLLELYELTLIIGTCSLILPVVVALPFAGSYCTDVNSGYFNMAIIRISKQQYVKSKVVVSMISGFLMVLIALVLFYITAIIIRPNVIARLDNLMDTYGEFWNRFVLRRQEWVVLLCKSLMLCVYGAIWPVIGLAVSTYAKNRYIVMASPFLVFLIQIYLVSYVDIRYLSLDNIPLRGCISEMSLGGIPYALAYSILLISGLSYLFYKGVGRKLKDG